MPGPPYVHPLGELRAVVGKPFSVICPAAGYPLEKVTWTKGELLNISGCKFNESYFSFCPIFGVDTKSTNSRVKKPPPRPQ